MYLRATPPLKEAQVVDKPTGPAMLELNPAADVEDRCEMSKRNWNSARRGKLAYGVLSFMLALVLVIAAVYAIIAFDDEESARGFLALIAAVGSLATSGFLALLSKGASKDEKTAWERVEKYCR
jgi:hypothetical protein